MRSIAMNTISTAALAVVLSLPLAAMAQTKDPAAASATTAKMQGADSREAKVEQRIADMHATLKITPTQETQFNAFAQVMLDNAQTMDALAGKDSAGRENQTADQMLKGYADITEQHAQNVQKLSTAFNPLYAALTPEQKKMADDMFRERAEQRDQNQKQGALTPEVPKPKQGG